MLSRKRPNLIRQICLKFGRNATRPEPWMDPTSVQFLLCVYGDDDSNNRSPIQVFITFSYNSHNHNVLILTIITV